MSDPAFPRPSVSVVVPTHDRVDLLAEAVTSVNEQTLQSWELIIVDDHSSDMTPKYLDGVVDPRVSHMRMAANVERSAARNRGLERAAAPFVLFLDDDDRLLPSALATLLRALRRRPDATAAVGGRTMIRPDGSRRRAAQPRLHRVRSVRTDVFFDWVGFPSQTLFRSDVVRAAGGWKEGLSKGEDRDLWIRIAADGPVVFVPQPVAEWRMREAATTPEGSVARRTRLLSDRARAVEDLPDDPALRWILSVSRRWVEGMNAYEQGSYREARRAFVDVARRTPRAFVSPLVGPMLWRMSLRAVVASMVGR